MKTIAFFNNKGGVGKTSLVYHLAWMFAELGVPVVAADLDPQANLTAMFLDEERLEAIWPDETDHPSTIFGAIFPILRGMGDIRDLTLEWITPQLALIPGDLGLSRFEDRLSSAWPQCHNQDEAAFRVMTAFYRVMRAAAEGHAELVLVDVGPNLGAINRSALISSDFVCFPLAPDLFSIQGMRNLGPTLVGWRKTWQDLTSKAPAGITLPSGSMSPAGYVVMQHGMRDSRPVKAYLRWMDRIPSVYRSDVLGEDGPLLATPKIANDPHCLAQLKHYRSLMPLAMEAHKPMFFLKPADGAIGAHMDAVKACREDFRLLATKIGTAVGLSSIGGN